MSGYIMDQVEFGPARPGTSGWVSGAECPCALSVLVGLGVHRHVRIVASSSSDATVEFRREGPAGENAYDDEHPFVWPVNSEDDR